MGELDVRIVRLNAMRVASVHAFGESPEPKAMEKLIAWAGPKGLLDDPANRRIFGFDNPTPSTGSPNYGYEFWIVVGPDVETDSGAEVKTFDGGLYAVTRCKGVKTISESWQKLAAWCESSRYALACHQCLEEHIAPDTLPSDPDELVLDLYCPIAE